MFSLEYVAGFFDGEGSIGIYKNKRNTYFLRTQVTQNINKETSELFVFLTNKFGGNLAKMRMECYRNGEVYNWQLNGKKAKTFLEKLIPFLHVKKEQAELAVAWQNYHPEPSRDEKGRMKKGKRDDPVDLGISKLLKQLKKDSLENIIENQKDLIEIIHLIKG